MNELLTTEEKLEMLEGVVHDYANWLRKAGHDYALSSLQSYMDEVLFLDQYREPLQWVMHMHTMNRKAL